MVARASLVKFNLSSVLLLIKSLKRSYDCFSLSKKSCPSGDDCIGASWQKSATPTLTRNVSKTIHFVKLVIIIDLENWKFSRTSELSFF